MTHLLKLNYFFLALWLCVIHSAVTYAADLTFTPASPILQVGEELTLTVAGATAPVTWSAQKGWIVGIGNEVIYKAPDQAGFDVVTVSDAAGNVGTLKIQLLPKSNLSEENAVWKVFSNLDAMQQIARVKGSNTFLATTMGGLVQYEMATGELKRIFTTEDGLPDNQVMRFLADQGGVWIGTANGLAYYSNSTEKLTRYETSLGTVSELIFDQNGGIWVSLYINAADALAISEGKKPGFSFGEVVHLDANRQLKEHPLDTVAMQLVDDEHGGVWLLTLNEEVNEGDERCCVLRHLLDNGEWMIHTAKALGLPGGFDLWRPEPDEQGGVWISTKGHVIHFNLAGDSRIYSAKEAGFSEEASIIPYFMNKDGTLRVGILDDESVFDLSEDGTWTPVILEIPEGLFWSADDGFDGLWAMTRDGHLWHRDTEKKWKDYPDTSNYPYSTRSLGDTPDGEGGVWMATVGEGLVHLTKDGQWEKGLTSSKLPLGTIYAMNYDTNGGGWILGNQISWPFDGDELMHTMILTRCQPESSELVCDPPEPNLPPQITSGSNLPKLLADEKGGLWLSSNEVGLFYRNPEGQWTTYDTTNSELPSDEVSAIVNDHNGGLWIGTKGGLAHLSQDQTWTIYTTSNSRLPYDSVDSLETDSTGGIWTGSSNGGGLAHFSSQGEWTVYTTDNSPLPNNNVTALLKGENGRLWIGTGKEKSHGGLVSYLSETGEWTTYETETELGSFPRFFISDQQGGVWASTLSSGLVHFDRNGQSLQFDSHNSGLPSDIVSSLLSDGQGGLWVGSFIGGLAHLTFPEKQTGNRAAIIIASGGNHQENSLWEATESTSNYLYKMLIARKFVKAEIYYLSSKDWADFNGDGFNDHIVDAPRERPLVLDDLRQAFAWAKERGQLNQPLYVFFMDHGGTEKLQLSKLDYLEATDLKAILDDYQAATGNQLVLVIEACYSGSLLPVLQAPERAIITSASANELANFVDKQGFIRFLTKYLFAGANFKESYELAQLDQNQMLGKQFADTTQSPQLDDNGDGVYDPTQDGQWLKQVKINGDLQMAALTLIVENLTTATTVAVGQPLPLQAKVVTANDDVKLVWAVIRPPHLNRVIDTNGTPILAFPHLNLSPSAETPDLWQATWKDAVYNGNYLLTFYAEDNEKNIASSELDTVLTVTGGIDPPPTAQVQLHLEKDRYQRGETFKATLTEDLGWGYDLYAAVLFPDGQNFMTLENTNELRPLNEAKPWYAQRKQSSEITLFDLTLPADLPTGEYCLFGILSPEQNEVFETLEKGLWVMERKCVEVF